MNETKIENIFKKYKRRYIAKLGNHPLDNTEIDLFCKSKFGNKYKGCFGQDAPITYKPGYYVFNTDISSKPGEHWLAVVCTKTTSYIFDTFSRSPEKLVPILVKRLKKQKLKIVSSDRSDAEQRATNKGTLVVNCGHSCLSFLTVAQEYGIRNAIKI
jgi:hypothetical protein